MVLHSGFFEYQACIQRPLRMLLFAHDAGEPRSRAHFQKPHPLQARAVRLVEVVGEQYLRVPNYGADIGDILQSAFGRREGEEGGLTHTLLLTGTYYEVQEWVQ